VIASLETARHARHRGSVRRVGFDLVIVDEAHRLRNHLTLGWKFINELGAKYLLLLTATPVQNDLRELYNLVTLLRPGQLGSYRSFRARFVDPRDPRRPVDAPRLKQLLSECMVRNRRSQVTIKFPPRRVYL